MQYKMTIKISHTNNKQSNAQQNVTLNYEFGYD